MKVQKILWVLVAALTAFAVILPAQAEDEVTVTAYATTNVRSGPGTSYSVIARLFEGEEAQATGRSDTSNDWLRISLDDGEGWVASSVVTIEGDPTSLEIVEPASGEVTQGNTDVTLSADEPANVRVGPSTDYPIVGQLDTDTRYDVTGRTSLDSAFVCRGNTITDLTENDREETVWIEINFNGYEVWVNYTVVNISGDLCAVEETTINEENVEALEQVEEVRGQVVVITVNNTNLRASNYSNAEVIAVIPYDTALEAEARNSDGSRLRVTYDEQTGWIAISQVDVLNGNVDDLPVEEE